MDLDALLDQLNRRRGALPADPEDDRPVGDGDAGSVSRDGDARAAGAEAAAGESPRRLRMRLRGALLDPGRRGARALLIAAMAAVAATALWVIIDEPAGGAAPLSRIASSADAGADAVPLAGAATPASGGSGPPVPPGPAGTAAAAVVVVHVAGMVAAPGVYALPEGARVADAIDAAGGAAPGADLTAVNLARRIVDGEQIAIGVAGAPAGGGPDAASGDVPAAGAAVDLNTADAAALDALPGVGPVLAQRILDWRRDNGRFASVEQLGEVPGIGPATLSRLAPLVRV